jgi:hypothetical protein
MFSGKTAQRALQWSESKSGVVDDLRRCDRCAMLALRDPVAPQLAYQFKQAYRGGYYATSLHLADEGQNVVGPIVHRLLVAGTS